MSQYQRDWYLGTKFIGSATFTPDPVIPHYSEVFACPKCGEIWARTVVEGTDWWPLRVRCQRCAPPFFVLQYNESLALGPDSGMKQILETGTPSLLNFIVKRLLDAAEVIVNESISGRSSSVHSDSCQQEPQPFSLPSGGIGTGY